MCTTARATEHIDRTGYTAWQLASQMNQAKNEGEASNPRCVGAGAKELLISLQHVLAGEAQAAQVCDVCMMQCDFCMWHYLTTCGSTAHWCTLVT
mmetsp:Transcript_18848/g.32193  ORF Transcript_18848/g.32193 Transcript_18848/m.32193 type:complete len:95 (+) Transcript_18848:189-473(+)